MLHFNHSQALISKAVRKARKHLSEVPLARQGALRVRFLQFEGFYLVETHSTSKGVMLQILDARGKAKLKVTYLPWRVLHFSSEDFGWLRDFFGLENSRYIEVYSQTSNSVN